MGGLGLVRGRGSLGKSSTPPPSTHPNSKSWIKLWAFCFVCCFCLFFCCCFFGGGASSKAGKHPDQGRVVPHSLFLSLSPGTLDVREDVSTESMPRLSGRLLSLFPCKERSFSARLATADARRGVGKVLPTTTSAEEGTLVGGAAAV